MPTVRINFEEDEWIIDVESKLDIGAIRNLVNVLNQTIIPNIEIEELQQPQLSYEE